MSDSINPIDSGRYGNPEMIKIFTDRNKIALWAKIEVAVAKVQTEMGIIPDMVVNDLEFASEKITLEEVQKIEEKTRHDIAAFIEAMSKYCNNVARCWIHYGLTSSDIKDTALAIQMGAGIDILIRKVKILRDVLVNRAIETEDLITIGRTHGQHAAPTTYGLRFAVWADEISRHIIRLSRIYKSAITGKMSDSTGSFATLGVKGIEFQYKVLSELGLETPLATTQIVQRDRHVEVIFTLANLAATIEKIATDLRNLQRTEINETEESFTIGQVGSSAMPHKENPIGSEQICGTARYIRSLVAPALEDVISWEERDLTQSSTERLIIPQSFILTDYITSEMTKIINGLIINKDKIADNLKEAQKFILSEYMMSLLIGFGYGRVDSHSAVKRLMNEDDPIKAFKRDYSHINFNIDDYYNSIREVSRAIVSVL